MGFNSGFKGLICSW